MSTICIAIVTVLPFLITLNAPLVHDSYGLIAEAARDTWAKAAAYFTHPTGSVFFRPLGYFSFWLDFKWAGYNPFRWHLWSLIVHFANTYLVYVLARELCLKRFPASIAALVFGLHGSRAEAVSWTAARLDLLASLFTLLSLIALNRYIDTRRSQYYVPMIGCAVLAVLSKESAYCLPFLAAGLLPFKDRTVRKDIFRAAAVLLAICGAIFLYRYWVIGGMGGYWTVSGEPAVLQFSAVRTIKAVFFRQWSLLFFPINWSSTLGGWTEAAVVLFLVVMVGFLIWSQPSVRHLSAAILFLFLAEVPVHHLLLMTADLAGSRVLYLPVLAIALFWGLVVQGCPRKVPQLALSAGLLIFQFAALTHNLLTWREVAFLAQRTCRAAAIQIGNDDRTVIIRGLPSTWHGVFFLGNGFPECVQMNSPHPLKASIYLDGGQQPGGHSRTSNGTIRPNSFSRLLGPLSPSDKER